MENEELRNFKLHTEYQGGKITNTVWEECAEESS